jgi:hypothetical protein
MPVADGVVPVAVVVPVVVVPDGDVLLVVVLPAPLPVVVLCAGGMLVGASSVVATPDVVGVPVVAGVDCAHPGAAVASAAVPASNAINVRLCILILRVPVLRSCEAAATAWVVAPWTHFLP